MINTDKLNNIPSHTAANATFTLLDRVQDLQPEAQLVATGALFQLLCEAQGVDPQDVMTAARNVQIEEGERHPEFTAIAAYMEHEISAS